MLLLGIPGLPCPCCPPRLPDSIFSTSTPTPVSSILSNSTPSLTETPEKPKDPSKEVLFTASVAELRRKAQEHSAAIWQSLQQFQQSSDKELPEVPKDLVKVPKTEDLK